MSIDKFMGLWYNYAVYEVKKYSRNTMSLGLVKIAGLDCQHFIQSYYVLSKHIN